VEIELVARSADQSAIAIADAKLRQFWPVHNVMS
jgi:hypothetical protein